jgi:hypothetical protein
MSGKVRFGTVGGLILACIIFTLTACGGGGESGSPNYSADGTDTQAPTAPTNLVATAVNSTQISLTWTASSDNVGVAGYKVFRGGSQIGTSSSSAYSDTGLSSGTTYTYTVTAHDAASNTSTQSTPASATTGASGNAAYSISGQISSGGSGLAGVIVALSGASSANVTADDSGNYTFSGLSNGSYSVTPSKTDYTFTPANLSVTVDGANVTGQNFSASIASAGSSWTLLKLPDTGQTAKYSTVFGEDADYTINPPSYTDNGNDTITDNVTGLVWQKQDDGTKKTWADAGAYCDALALGGHTDWRLPSDIELMSVVDYGKSIGPVMDASDFGLINKTYFPNTKSSYYWSSSTYAYSTGNAWSVSFYKGNVDYDDKSGTDYVRCVRGEQ